jgi:hypothetical protein
MTPDERARIKQILDHHDEAARAARATSDALDRLVADTRQMLSDLGDVNDANRAEIDAMLAANRAALRLYNGEP